MSIRISTRSTAKKINNEIKPTIPSQNQQQTKVFEEDLNESETEESEPVKKYGSSNESPTPEDEPELKNNTPSNNISKSKNIVDENNNSNDNDTTNKENKNEENILEEQNKKRRRDKNASKDILNVINWDLGETNSYQGSNTIPDVPKVSNSSNSSKNNEIKNDEEQANEKQPLENQDPEEDDKVFDSPKLTNGYSDHSNKEQSNEDKIEDEELKESLSFLDKLPKDISKITDSGFLGNLMNQYLNDNNSTSKPSSPTPRIRKTSTDTEKLEELERNLKALRSGNKKHLPPPVRNKPRTSSKVWDDPREHQRQKNKEKSWPPREDPKDIGAYVVESYGQTDPYSKKLIKDIQKQKREEEELKEAQKRAEIVKDSVKPVSHLKSTFDSKPPRPKPGTQRPESNINEERSWIKHEKKEVEFDKPPDEPDWMKLIRNRRWKSTVKARFPCQDNDRTDFERRSTTPKNWKRLAKDKHALKMLSEIVGIGAEGEELFQRLASQRQKIEEEQEALDKLAEEELLAYEVARESLGEDAAYQLQMDNPLPAARMKKLPSTSTIKEIPTQDKLEQLSQASGQYPFTTSQLEAAYITNQLLRLHPEEFRKLMSLERSRQATLRWQFSSDPFDSVHDHQSLPFEIALLASEEPRVQQAMKKILSQTPSEDFRSVFSGQTTPRGSRARSVSGSRRASSCDLDSDLDGYESGHSVSSGGSTLPRGRSGSQRKKKPVPLPKTKSRNRSASPSMVARRKDSGDNLVNGPLLTVPPQKYASDAMKQLEDDREVHSHGLLSDQELQLSEEIAKLQELTSNLSGNIDEELKEIEASLGEDKREYLREILNKEKYFTDNNTAKESIDLDEIAQRRKQFLHKEKESQIESNIQDALPKKRHKVRRIQSATQLDAVLRRRRKMSESNLEGTDDDDDDNTSEIDKTEEKPSDDMKNLLNDINSAYGNEK